MIALQMLEHSVGAIRVEDDGEGCTATEGKPGTKLIIVGMLFGSVRSAMTKRAMCANVTTVSVRSRLDGFVPNRMGM